VKKEKKRRRGIRVNQQEIGVFGYMRKGRKRGYY
jgi:hypothetical protein